MMTPIHDQILGQLAAHDPIPTDAWDAFEFLFRRGSLGQKDLSICLLRYVQALAELKENGLIKLAMVTASDRHWVLTDDGRERINAVLGLADVDIQQLQDMIQDRLEEMLKEMSVTGSLAHA